LIAESMADWAGNANKIVSDVKANNKKIQRSINEIGNSVNVAANVVKLVGFVDEVVDIVDGIT